MCVGVWWWYACYAFYKLRIIIKLYNLGEAEKSDKLILINLKINIHSAREEGCIWLKKLLLGTYIGIYLVGKLMITFDS